MRIPESELIINDDNSIYHLKLKPGDLAETIITVGDQNRVKMVSGKFDKILLEVKNREFYTITGLLNGKKISVISTGIGTDNIDIVFNEIDAIFNVDFETRKIKEKLTKLNFIRIGTSGTIQKDIAIDSFIVSQYAIGFDTLAQFYEQDLNENEQNLFNQIKQQLADNKIDLPFYLSAASKKLLNLFTADCKAGITITNPGFYAPQGRNIRAKSKFNNLIAITSKLKLNDKKVTNLEMETAGIYLLSNILGHNAISLNAILANRATSEFSENANETIGKLIDIAIDKIVGIL